MLQDKKNKFKTKNAFKEKIKIKTKDFKKQPK